MKIFLFLYIFQKVFCQQEFPNFEKTLEIYRNSLKSQNIPDLFRILHENFTITKCDSKKSQITRDSLSQMFRKIPANHFEFNENYRLNLEAQSGNTKRYRLIFENLTSTIFDVQNDNLILSETHRDCKSNFEPISTSLINDKVLAANYSLASYLELLQNPGKNLDLFLLPNFEHHDLSGKILNKSEFLAGIRSYGRIVTWDGSNFKISLTWDSGALNYGCYVEWNWNGKRSLLMFEIGWVDGEFRLRREIQRSLPEQPVYTALIDYKSTIENLASRLARQFTTAFAFKSRKILAKTVSSEFELHICEKNRTLLSPEEFLRVAQNSNLGEFKGKIYDLVYDLEREKINFWFLSGNIELIFVEAKSINNLYLLTAANITKCLNSQEDSKIAQKIEKNLQKLLDSYVRAINSCDFSQLPATFSHNSYPELMPDLVLESFEIIPEGEKEEMVKILAKIEGQNKVLEFRAEFAGGKWKLVEELRDENWKFE
ncbi:unnamed protein product [Caenorhabditis angaria]|uniref:F-box associated domain-containing protein n=1 Tax=Caenorhabditis angaria TaxID=860376 RepID=A0A9P1ILT5_9PELO|nr:unnamed protein product [Caenorhabditis angaria]